MSVSTFSRSLAADEPPLHPVVGQSQEFLNRHQLQGRSRTHLLFSQVAPILACARGCVSRAAIMHWVWKQQSGPRRPGTAGLIFDCERHPRGHDAGPLPGLDRPCSTATASRFPRPLLRNGRDADRPDHPHTRGRRRDRRRGCGSDVHEKESSFLDNITRSDRWSEW